MKNIDLIREFINRPKQSNAINHLAYYGNGLINYSTVLLTLDREQMVARFNVRKYSTTTSRIQTMIRRELEAAGYTVVEYDGEPCSFYWNYGYMGAPTVTKKDAERKLG